MPIVSSVARFLAILSAGLPALAAGLVVWDASAANGSLAALATLTVFVLSLRYVMRPSLRELVASLRVLSWNGSRPTRQQRLAGILVGATLVLDVIVGAIIGQGVWAKTQAFGPAFGSMLLVISPGAYAFIALSPYISGVLLAYSSLTPSCNRS
jgi:hypothetical protein